MCVSERIKYKHLYLKPALVRDTDEGLMLQFDDASLQEGFNWHGPFGYPEVILDKEETDELS